MEKIKEFFGYCLTSEGRVPRLPYLADIMVFNFLTLAITMVVAVPVTGLVFLFMPEKLDVINWILLPFNLVFGLMCIWAGFTFPIRRLHDLGRSGWHLFFLLVPIYNIYLGILMIFVRGDYGPNQYGQDPIPDISDRATFWRRIVLILPITIFLLASSMMFYVFTNPNAQIMLTNWAQSMEKQLVQMEFNIEQEYAGVEFESSRLAYYNGLSAQTRDGLLEVFSEMGYGTIEEPDVLLSGLKQACAHGSGKACAALGLIHFHGLAGEVDYEEAEVWVDSAIKTGEPIGYYYKGLMHMRGRGTAELSGAKAITHIYQAAETGLVEAQVDLANLYAEAGDMQEAHVWWRAASSQGDLFARQALESFVEVDKNIERELQNQAEEAMRLMQKELLNQFGK